MKWIKKNKMMIIAIVVFSVIALIGYKALKVFFPSTSAAIYGDRLDNKIELEDNLLDGIKERMSGQEFVKEVKVDVKGRIIKIFVTIMDSTSMDAAKGLTGLVLEGFTDSQIGYYDFSLYISKENNEVENDFPIIAYKQHNSVEFSWTRNRDKVVETQEETQEGEEK